MSEFRVSSKYASSLLQVAVKKNILDDIYKDNISFAAHVAVY
jgi:F0F1-type ATP synthase delta subunit